MYKLIFCLFAVGTMGFSYASEKEAFVEADQDWEASTLSIEPPIYAQFTNEKVQIKKPKVVLNTFFLTHPAITTREGEKFFTPADDGLIVNEPGLYRISFFQKVHTLNAECQLIFNLERVYLNGYSPLRTQEINLGNRQGTDIQFTQIVRMNAGDKLRLTLEAYKGEATLLNGNNVSGLIVEAIGK